MMRISSDLPPHLAERLETLSLERMLTRRTESVINTTKKYDLVHLSYKGKIADRPGGLNLKHEEVVNVHKKFRQSFRATLIPYADDYCYFENDQFNRVCGDIIAHDIILSPTMRIRMLFHISYYGSQKKIWVESWFYGRNSLPIFYYFQPMMNSARAKCYQPWMVVYDFPELFIVPRPFPKLIVVHGLGQPPLKIGYEKKLPITYIGSVVVAYCHMFSFAIKLLK